MKIVTITRRNQTILFEPNEYILLILSDVKKFCWSHTGALYTTIIDMNGTVVWDGSPSFKNTSVPIPLMHRKDKILVVKNRTRISIHPIFGHSR